MTLLRAAYRTMLASYFIASGVKALRDPDSLVPAAEPLTDRVVPLLKEYAPQQVAGYLPEDTRTLVRVNGATQVVGGLALASGKGRRLGALLLAGSLVPSTIAKHPFWSRSDSTQRAEDQHQFLKNVSLLGGVLLASRDTEGRPSLAWRAEQGGKAIAKTTGKASDKLSKRASALTDGGSDLAETALATGAALVGTVVTSTRKARKQAVKQFKAAKKLAAERAQQAKARAAERAKEEQKVAAIRAKEEQKLAAVRAKEEQKAAAVRAKEEQKAAAALAKEARKADKRAKNIERGEN